MAEMEVLLDYSREVTTKADITGNFSDVKLNFAFPDA